MGPRSSNLTCRLKSPKPAVNNMGRVTATAIACLLLTAASVTAQPKEQRVELSDAKQILFLGNSITYAGDYVTLFESFYITRNPSSTAEVINVGLPSETVSGLSEPGHADGAFPRPWLFSRLNSVLEKTQPDVVFACYGMNDGIYLPFDEERFTAYKVGMERLRAELKRAGVKRIIFVTPPVHDDAEKGLEGYNLVLDRYAQWLLEQRDRNGWEVIDLHFPMCAYLAERRKSDPAFRLANDGIHPGAEGHWLMAQALMAYFEPAMAEVPSRDAFLSSNPTMARLYALLGKRQAIMKDAWLSYTGHERPGMKKGLPMEEARARYGELGREIRR